jgi:hypothetical protein
MYIGIVQCREAIFHMLILVNTLYIYKHSRTYGCSDVYTYKKYLPYKRLFVQIYIAANRNARPYAYISGYRDASMNMVIGICREAIFNKHILVNIYLWRPY